MKAVLSQHHTPALPAPHPQRMCICCSFSAGKMLFHVLKPPLENMGNCESCPIPCDCHGLWLARLLCPWDSPDKNTGVGCHHLLQGIFLTQGSNLGFRHCRQIFFLPSEPPEKPMGRPGRQRWDRSGLFAWTSARGTAFVRSGTLPTRLASRILGRRGAAAAWRRDCCCFSFPSWSWGDEPGPVGRFNDNIHHLFFNRLSRVLNPSPSTFYPPLVSSLGYRGRVKFLKQEKRREPKKPTHTHKHIVLREVVPLPARGKSAGAPMRSLVAQEPRPDWRERRKGEHTHPETFFLVANNRRPPSRERQ